MGRFRVREPVGSKYITRSGAERLRRELDELWREERPRVTLAVQGGGAHGAFAWGVLDALLNIEGAWVRRRLMGADQFLPLLDQIAQNEIYLHMARQRAAILGEAIRASKAKSQ